MLGAFRNRRPWLAAVIAFFSPFIAMLFLNRGRWALVYLGALLLIAAIGFAALPTIAAPSPIEFAIQSCATLLGIIGSLHAFFIAKKWDVGQLLHWYARRWYVIAAIFYGFFGILLIVRTYFYQPFNVPSAGMSPTLNVGDFFLASKSAYRSKEPARGDIIVFHPSGSFAKYSFVKRIVGMPGERIQLKNGALFINGLPVLRRRVQNFSMNCGGGQCSVAQYEERLPSAHPYNIAKIEPHGRPDNMEAVMVPANAYFVLGDNRDNSADSRHDLGFVLRKNIIGRAAFKYIANGHWTWEPIN